MTPGRHRGFASPSRQKRCVKSRCQPLLAGNSPVTMAQVVAQLQGLRDGNFAVRRDLLNASDVALFYVYVLAFKRCPQQVLLTLVVQLWRRGSFRTAVVAVQRRSAAGARQPGLSQRLAPCEPSHRAARRAPCAADRQGGTLHPRGGAETGGETETGRKGDGRPAGVEVTLWCVCIGSGGGRRSFPCGRCQQLAGGCWPWAIQVRTAWDATGLASVAAMRDKS